MLHLSNNHQPPLRFISSLWHVSIRLPTLSDYICPSLQIQEVGWKKSPVEKASSPLTAAVTCLTHRGPKVHCKIFNYHQSQWESGSRMRGIWRSQADACTYRLRHILFKLVRKTSLLFSQSTGTFLSSELWLCVVNQRKLTTKKKLSVGHKCEEAGRSQT